MGKNVKQVVNRALSFARSDPKGPVYLCGAREVMEQEIEPYTVNQEFWNPVEPTALPPSAIKRIAEALVNAEEPLIVTGYSGRNHECPAELVKLADAIPHLRILDTGGSDMCFPANHPAWLGLRYGNHEAIRTADVILVLDCDVPWIPTQCKPKASCLIFHVDVDPLKQQMPVFYLDAVARYKADSFHTIWQVNDFINSNPELKQKAASTSSSKRESEYKSNLASIANLAKPGDDGTYKIHYLINRVRHFCPEDTVWCIEAVTNSTFVSDHIQATEPGSWINCGGGGLGWSGGASLGIKLAVGEKKFVCQIVGDGTFLFSVPGSVYWIAARYKIPTLTIVLNNKGWNAPRRSLLLVHPHGEGSKVSNEELNISFAPTPDYAGIAKAAAGGELFAAIADTADSLNDVLPKAVKSVLNGTPAVIDAFIDGPSGKYNGAKSETVAVNGAANGATNGETSHSSKRRRKN